MIRVGIIGIGFMGMVHYRSYQEVESAEVVAICDRSPERLMGDWSEIKGNFGEPGSHVNLAGVATYDDLERLLSDRNVDLVDITLPPALHADVAIQAMQAGKHVFCEKPMAMTLEQCDQMIAVAKQHQKILQVGHVLPFFPEYRWALQEIRSGQYGRLLGGKFTRLISEPTWLPDYWNPGKVGGPLLDLHVHDAHFIRLLFGMPSSATTTGSLRNGLPESWHTKFEFDSGTLDVQATGGVQPDVNQPFFHGFEISLEQATLEFALAVKRDGAGNEAGRYLVPPRIVTGYGNHEAASLGDGDPCRAFRTELQTAIHAVQGRTKSDILSCNLARDALEICQMQTHSLTRSTVSSC